MTVYVDFAKNRYGRMIMCHMLSDSTEELHTMADKIGVQRKWFQDGNVLPHYDICLIKRKLAIRYGAQEIGKDDVLSIIKRLRSGKIGE